MMCLHLITSIKRRDNEWDQRTIKIIIGSQVHEERVKGFHFDLERGGLGCNIRNVYKIKRYR